jgi:hypothetical protein
VPSSRHVSVDWRSARAVVLQSDDWGFPGWSTSPDDRPQVEVAVAHYATSTLESATDVEAIADLLAAATGRDGLPAVLQPNYVMFSPAFAQVEPGADPPFDRFPDYAGPWERPGLGAAVEEAMRRGVWWPEHHAALHCDLDRFRRRAAERTGNALAAWQLGRWEIEDQDGRAEYAAGPAHVESGVRAFAEVFGRPAASTAPPGYVLPVEAGASLRRNGIELFQAPRRSRWAGRRPPLPARVAARFARVVTPTGVERTVDFEPAQGIDAASIVARCKRDWARGRPAVVSTHRANFVNWDSAIVERSRDALGRLLRGLDGAVFMTDAELAQLDRSGVSIGCRGDRLVIRNYSGRARSITFDHTQLARIGVDRADLTVDAAVGESLFDVDGL